MIIGRNRLFSLLKKHKLLVPNKRAYHRTALSHHRFHRHPNLVKAGGGPKAARTAIGRGYNLPIDV